MYNSNENFLNNVPDTLSLKELCGVLKIGRTKALELVNTNIIEGHMVAGKWLFLKPDVIDYIIHT